MNKLVGWAKGLVSRFKGWVKENKGFVAAVLVLSWIPSFFLAAGFKDVALSIFLGIGWMVFILAVASIVATKASDRLKIDALIFLVTGLILAVVSIPLFSLVTPYIPRTPPGEPNQMAWFLYVLASSGLFYWGSRD